MILFILASIILNTLTAGAVGCSDAYLSDMTPTDVQLGWTGSGDGVNYWFGSSTMEMGNGEVYSNFIVIHPNHGTSANAHKTYNLNGEYTKFTAVVGSARTSNGCQNSFSDYGSFSIAIIVDGVQKYYRNGYGTTGYDEVSIDVTDAQEIRIETDNGDNNDWTCDHPAIADPGLCTVPDCDAIIDGARARYTGNSYVSGGIYGKGIWQDVSGNGRDIDIKNYIPSVLTDSKSGEQYLQGLGWSRVDFPADLLGDTAATTMATDYTFLHVCRYVENQQAGQIFDGKTSFTGDNSWWNTQNYWFSGFNGWSFKKRGIASHGFCMITEWDDNINVDESDFVLHVDQWTKLRANGIDVTSNMGCDPDTPTFQGQNAETPYSVSINGGNRNCCWEKTAWECAEIIAWDGELSQDEIETLEQCLMDKYSIPSPSGSQSVPQYSDDYNNYLSITKPKSISPSGDNGIMTIIISSYLLWIICGLLIVNVICMSIYFWNKWKSNVKGKKKGYKVVKYDDSEVTDV